MNEQLRAVGLAKSFTLHNQGGLELPVLHGFDLVVGTGECVVIDGAQWLRGAGEFNDLLILPEAVWQEMEAARQKNS